MAYFPKKKFIPRVKVIENVNEGIRAPEVRTIFPDGSNEILQTTIALQRARALDLDLIVVSPTAKPPVAKIEDYGKFVYEQKKHQHEAKKKQHITQIKELKFRPSTDHHDYEFKKKHAIEFLKEGHKVKATVVFRGREIAHTDLGRDLLLRLAEDTKIYGTVEGFPKVEGKNATMLVSPMGKPKS